MNVLYTFCHFSNDWLIHLIMQLQPNLLLKPPKAVRYRCAAVLNVWLNGAHCNQNLLFSWNSTVWSLQITSCWIIYWHDAHLIYILSMFIECRTNVDMMWLFAKGSLWLNLVSSVASQKGSVDILSHGTNPVWWACMQWIELSSHRMLFIQWLHFGSIF